PWHTYSYSPVERTSCSAAGRSAVSMQNTSVGCGYRTYHVHTQTRCTSIELRAGRSTRSLAQALAGWFAATGRTLRWRGAFPRLLIAPGIRPRFYTERSTHASLELARPRHHCRSHRYLRHACQRWFFTFVAITTHRHLLRRCLLPALDNLAYYSGRHCLRGMVWNRDRPDFSCGMGAIRTKT